MSKQPPKDLNATALRANLYQLLDGVIETGKPLIINRKGEKLVISLKNQPSRIERLLSTPRKLVDKSVSEDQLIYHGMGEYKIDETLAEFYDLDED